MRKNIIVIDSKLVFYYQFHRHKHPFNCFEDVSDKIIKHLPQPIAKVIWVRDEGHSKRKEFFPQYKAHRRAGVEKMNKAEQDRRASFEKLYVDSRHFLEYFGNVLSIRGYEADDLASMVAERFKFSEDYNVILVTSDEDWSRFLYGDNIKILHYSRDKIITRDMCESEFGVSSEYKLFVDSCAGVRKENVDGIKKAGKVRVIKALDESEYDLEKAEKILQEWCDKKKYGITLPEWASSVVDVVERNMKILSPIGVHDMDEEELKLFKEQFSTRKHSLSQEIMLESIEKFNYPLNLSTTAKKIYGVS